MNKLLYVMNRDLKRSYKNLFKVNIFIYQMGKVGSSTLYKSIKNAAQFHNFDTDTPQKYFSPVKVGIYGKMRWKFWFWTTKVRINYLKKNGKVKLVSLARDPVARNISAYFQVLENKPNLKKESSVLIKDFFETTNHDVPLTWFDLELKKNFGIDIYDYDFPKEKGYLVIEKGNIELLLLKLEKMSECLIAIKEFLEVADFNVVNANHATEKWYSQLYKDFKQEIIFPKTYLDKMYNSRYANYFYTDEEINKFYSKWLKVKQLHP